MYNLVYDVFSFASSVIFYYPLIMSLIWMIGGLFFYCKNEKNTGLFPVLEKIPSVSVLVPARNEVNNLKETVKALLASEYPDMEIIVVDDASTDGTAEILQKLSAEHDIVRGLYLRQRKGKADALNYAFLAANNEIILTIDADCLLEKQAIYWMAWHFANFPRVGAVTGNPQVRNRTTLLAQLQTAEYTSVIGLVKRTQRILGKLLTVSGVIAAFRREALVDAGLWSHDMVTEDIDLTWKLEKRFWDVRYEANAVGWILVPETFAGLAKQRVRWSQGGVETIRKHCNVWQDRKQMRIWPVYLDYVLVIAWSFTFFFCAAFWLLHLPAGVNFSLLPEWNGTLIAAVCLLQFLVSVAINRRYDKKLATSYFPVIWYPLFYWFFNASVTLIGFYKGMTKKFGSASIWDSPDRGIVPVGIRNEEK